MKQTFMGLIDNIKKAIEIDPYDWTAYLAWADAIEEMAMEKKYPKLLGRLRAIGNKRGKGLSLSEFALFLGSRWGKIQKRTRWFCRDSAPVKLRPRGNGCPFAATHALAITLVRPGRVVFWDWEDGGPGEAGGVKFFRDIKEAEEAMVKRQTLIHCGNLTIPVQNMDYRLAGFTIISMTDAYHYASLTG